MWEADLVGRRGNDEEFLLAVLNSTPVVDGVVTDQLADVETAHSWLVQSGGVGSEAELAHVHKARAALQEIVRGRLPTSALASQLRGVRYLPQVDAEITWLPKVAPDRELALRAILAWAAVVREQPGRLRPCANAECRLFLIDRTPANRARWCSMAVCGNRMKARRHYERARSAVGTTTSKDAKTNREDTDK